MPTMTEIYQNHSFEYDELVSHEDYPGNLPKTLHSIFDFNQKSVIELGVGTGRLTKIYIQKAKKAFCCDRSQHMLDKAGINLKKYQNKISFSICDNNKIDSIDEKADFVIEGWSFGHTVADNADSVISIADKLVSSCESRLERDGKIIIIETLGTNTETPSAPGETLEIFYSLLEQKYSFNRVVITTDYRFSSVDEAVRMMGFFFGEKMAKSILEKESAVVKEFTGIWYK